MPPGEDGKWYFAATDTIAVSFNKNEDDKVVSIVAMALTESPKKSQVETEPMRKMIGCIGVG